MYKEIECPFKDSCVNNYCIIKLYDTSYLDPYNMCDMLQNIDFIIPTFSVSYFAAGTTFKLRCHNYKGKVRKNEQ